MQTSSIETNPFASPRIIPVEAPKIQRGKNGRASEKELRSLCIGLAVAEVSYLAGCAAFFLQFFLTNYNHEIQTAAMLLPYACFAVTWISLFSIYRLTAGVVGAIASFFMFPIPVFGTLIFLSGLQQSKTFLLHNGYQRTFIGGKPNPKERQQMAKDENYYPSACFDRQGNRLSRPKPTLFSYILALLLVIALATLAFT